MSWIHKGQKPHHCQMPNPIPDDVEKDAVWQCDECRAQYAAVAIYDQRKQRHAHWMLVGYTAPIGAK